MLVPRATCSWLPGGLGQFLAQDLGGVDLDHHLAVEVESGVEVQVGVALAGEAVDARMAAAAVGVDGPVERHPGTGDHLVEHRFGGDLMEGDPGKFGGGDRPHESGQRQQGSRGRSGGNGGRGIAALKCLCVPSHAYIRIYVRLNVKDADGRGGGRLQHGAACAAAGIEAYEASRSRAL